ncbi:hypothetical protein AK812_SmicGene19744 [Symbiodinium microadriaticum]|uniref:Uncharacterized protein n=1 Tax=Symbiodinium microadriaticum TaxID=2951 RepID=A0A1Q9DRQ9_SYMMI|nr:hypothetical protein AK812_SmicGene19744 [Symbiodinium microadriaticum]
MIVEHLGLERALKREIGNGPSAARIQAICSEDQRVYFRGVSHGQEWEVSLKLLRSINVSTSKYDLDKKGVNFDLPKLVSEPCWKRLLKSKKPMPHIKKDTSRLYPDECYEKMLQWREAYFYAKLHPEEARKSEPEAKADRPDPKAEENKEYERKLEALRSKAIPRPHGINFTSLLPLWLSAASVPAETMWSPGLALALQLWLKETTMISHGLQKKALSACQAWRLLSSIVVHGFCMLCSLMLALLRLAAGAEECAGVEFLEGHVTHARKKEKKKKKTEL